MAEPIPAVKRPVWKTLLPLVIALVMVPSLGMMQRHIDNKHEEATINELLYFPNDKMLRHFTAGLDNVVADFLWFRTVQYTGETFASRDQKFTWLEHMINVTTHLSPQYEDPYRYGGSLLAALDTEGTGRAENALNVLKRGFVNVPHSWAIPYEMHVIYLMNRRNEPKANVLASRYALLIAKRHDEAYKESFLNLSQRLLVNEDDHDAAIELFTEAVEKETDPMLRALAEHNLLVSYIEKNVHLLNKATESYRDIHGELPESLDQLIDDGIIGALPADPEQGSYFIHPTSLKVRNTVIESERAERLARRLTKLAESYRDEHGDYPPDLDTIFEYSGKRRYTYPLGEGFWDYDPATGTATVPAAE